MRCEDHIVSKCDDKSLNCKKSKENLAPVMISGNLDTFIGIKRNATPFQETNYSGNTSSLAALTTKKDIVSEEKLNQSCTSKDSPPILPSTCMTKCQEYNSPSLAALAQSHQNEDQLCHELAQNCVFKSPTVKCSSGNSPDYPPFNSLHVDSSKCLVSSTHSDVSTFKPLSVAQSASQSSTFLNFSPQTSGMSLAEMAIEQSSNSPSESVSLAELAKHQSKNSSLLNNSPHSSRLSLADMAEQHNNDSNILCKNSPQSCSMSLADMAKQHNKDSNILFKNSPQSSSMSLANLAKQHNQDSNLLLKNSPQGNNLSLADIAKQHNKDRSLLLKNSPQGSSVSLADIANSHAMNSNTLSDNTLQSSISLSGFSKRHRDVSDALPKHSSHGSGLSLADLANRHAQTDTSSEAIQGTFSGKPDKGLSLSGTPATMLSLANLAHQHVGMKPRNIVEPQDLPSKHSQALPIQKPTTCGIHDDLEIKMKESRPRNNLITASEKLSHLNLADMRRQDCSSDGTTSASRDKKLSSPKISTVGSRLMESVPMKCDPPPGFSNISSDMECHKIDFLDSVRKHKDSFSDSDSSSPGRAPPGFSALKVVDLSQIAAHHHVPAAKSTPHVYKLSEKTNPATVKYHDVVKAGPSTFAKTFCTSFSQYLQQPCENTEYLTQPRFSFEKQNVKKIEHKISLHSIKAFDFSTASPDDLVKSRQKWAFRRFENEGKLL